MNIDKKTPNERYSILMHGIKNKNISDTCKKFGVSRTIYYRWYNRFQKYGMEGLKEVTRKPHKIPNKVPKYIENEILKIIKKDPSLGPRSISYILEDEGYNVGETGVYNVMKRLNLNVKKKREEFYKNIEKIPSSNVVQKTQPKLMDLEKSYVGHLLIQWTMYLGNIKNIGKIYQITVLDAFSNYAIAKIYNSKASINVEDIMESSVIPTVRSLEVKIENIITKNSREYTTNWKNGKHRYDEYLKNKSINHLILYKDNYEIVTFIENFHKEIYEELYKNIIINSKDITFKDIETKLQEFLRIHNFKKKNHSHFNKGKTPIEIIVQDRGDVPLPLWFFVDIV